MTGSDDIAIRLRGVSKWFESHSSPAERFFRFFRAGRKPHERFNALQDISFDVAKGSSLGLLGRNGAGKSTLMQIIAGTMQPSEGRLDTHGRISPLLELGAGFNPEFTGSENVRLNAAVLGFSPDEIRKKEQEIADFADIGEFIDRPVRTYSSGMFARLAFAVAIHVDPEILLVDEILAVGDMGFQQKCLNRLREMREEGLTLIFVSHSPDSVKSVCDRAVFLDHGQIIYAGDADAAVDRYLAFIREASNEEQLRHEEQHPWKRPVARVEKLDAQLRYGSGHVQIVKVETTDAGGEPRKTFSFGDTIHVIFEIASTIDADDLSVSVVISDMTGTDLFGTTTFDEHQDLPPMRAGERQRVSFAFPAHLRVGNYGISGSVNRVTDRNYLDNFLFDALRNAGQFAVAVDVNRPVHYKVHMPILIKVGL